MAGTESSDRYKYVRIYVYIMFGFYPIFFHNYYFDIVTAKYILFLVLTGILLVITLFSLPSDILVNVKSGKYRPNICDIFVLGFLFINILSSIFSENSLYCITGADGRFVGLSTVVCVVIIYFIISRTFKLTEIFFVVVAIGSILVSVIAILQCAGFDFLGFYDNIEVYQTLFYISTIGHVDVFTSYLAIVIPMIFLAYLKTDTSYMKILYFAAVVLGFTALVEGQCDSGYIVLLTTVFLSIVFSESKISPAKFIAPIFSSFVVVRLMLNINDNLLNPRTVSKITEVIFSDTSLLIITIFFAICIFCGSSYKLNIEKYSRYFLWILLLIISGYVISVIMFTYIFSDFNLGRFEDVMRFSDSYGSYRGYLWRVLVKDFKEMPSFRKLLGVGTDALMPYLDVKYGEEMYKVTGAYYDNAHNEFLQYLMTTGIAGLICYAGMVISSFRVNLENKENKIIKAAIVCYLIQSFVNINQVITMPLLIILIAVQSRRCHR